MNTGSTAPEMPDCMGAVIAAAIIPTPGWSPIFDATLVLSVKLLATNVEMFECAYVGYCHTDADRCHVSPSGKSMTDADWMTLLNRNDRRHPVQPGAFADASPPAATGVP